MEEQNIKRQIDLLAKLVEDANRIDPQATTFGSCKWTDINGNARCNSPWSEFQCQQAGGTWTAGGSCP